MQRKINYQEETAAIFLQFFHKIAQQRFYLYLPFFSILFFCTSCSQIADTDGLAPLQTAIAAPAKGSHFHRVQRKETLYSIAFGYGLDYRDLAAINGLTPPYTLKVGDVLQLPTATSSKKLKRNDLTSQQVKKAWTYANLRRKTQSQLSNKTVRENKKLAEQQQIAAQQAEINLNKQFLRQAVWIWPARGRITQLFSPESGYKGIDIRGKWAEPVVSSKAGIVAYAGNGLRGYGNLLIIKHNDEFLTAYAYNQKLLVKEGQAVKQGQIIALMGMNTKRQIMLHFEIRKAGKPVNPLNYLSRK